MRTKTLLLAAGALAVGLVTSQAQVYSGIVGYQSLALTNGISLIAPQLDADGTGTNNTVESVFSTNLVAPTQVSTWSPSGNTNAINSALNSKGALFVNSPANVNITAVGTVIQGTNVISLTGGLFNLVNNAAPVGGGIQTTLGYVPSVGDKVLTWSPSLQQYVSCTYSTVKGVTKWNPFEPTITAGSGAFIQTSVTPGWTNGFTAQ